MLHHTTNSELQLLIIGDYLFEPQSGLLSGPSGAHHVSSQMSLLLCHLAERATEVLDRDSLAGEIWPDCPQASKKLVACVGRLRSYFGDTARSASYIETVNGHGYRLVAPVYGSTRRPVVVTPALNSPSARAPGSGIYRLFREFRQRKVCRSMLVYTIVIWLVFQVTDVVVEPLGLPEWVASLVVVLGLAGFPVAATLSWIFDLTPSGFVRDARPLAAAPTGTSRRWTDFAFDTALISAALVICGMLVASCFSPV